MSLSYSNSNSLKSNSEPKSLNTGKKNDKLEEVKFEEENNNTIIGRVWIVKKRIGLGDRHFFHLPFLMSDDVDLIKIEQNVFEINDGFICFFKHWAIILELSNGSYVNIQFGRNGFSLEEYNKSEIDGRNLLDAIIDVWGKRDCPISFCYLGNANYEYKNLKLKLNEIKKSETEYYNANGTTYYNFCFRNCQHFACDIERILFGKIKIWHSFEYYLNDFYKEFFPFFDLDKLKKDYGNEIKQKNHYILLADIGIFFLDLARKVDKPNQEKIGSMLGNIIKKELNS